MSKQTQKGGIGFGATVAIAGAVVAAIAVNRYIDLNAPYWQANNAFKLASRQQELVESVARQRAWTDALTTMYGYAPLVVLVSFGVCIWVVWHKRVEASRRAVNGQFALQVHKQNGVWLVVDPNKQVFGTIAQLPDGHVLTDAERVGPDRQLEYARSIERSHQTRALAHSGAAKYAAFGKLVGGMYDRVAGRPTPTQPAQPDQPAQLEQPKMLTLNEAWKASTPDEWVLGQSPDNGELFKLRPADTAHFGIVGATGTGKTAYAALLVVANALASGWHVVVLDGKGGADWSKYDSWVEYHKLDTGNVGTYVARLFARHEARQVKLNVAGANNIWLLPPEQGQKPVLVVVDEFGYVMDELHRADKQEYADVSQTLDNLLRLSRSTGIYLVPCDQNPSRWPSTMKSNLPTNIAFKIGGKAAYGINVYNADKLERSGQFVVDNVVYNGWLTAKHADEILVECPKRDPKQLFLKDVGAGKTAFPTLRITTDAQRQNDGPHAPRVQVGADELPAPSGLVASFVQDNCKNDASFAPDSLNLHKTDTFELSDQKLAQNLQTAQAAQAAQATQAAQPKLDGKPRSSAEWEQVLEAYDRNGGNVHRTAIEVWGKHNKPQGNWIQEALERVGRPHTAA